MNIVIAGDSNVIRKRAQQSLELSLDGCLVSEAKNQEEGLMLIQSVIPDIVIIHVTALNEKNIDFLQNIRYGHEQMTLILLTDCYNSIIYNLSTKIGADYVFETITEFDDMVNVVRLLGEVAECEV